MGQKRTKPAQVLLPQPGDAFLMPLDDGRFGVCRMLWESTEQQATEYGAPHVLVAASSWIGTQMPDLDDPLLREIQQLTHHSWNNPNMNRVTQPPPESFQKIGVIEPTPAEKVMRCIWSGGWSLAGQLLMQWRWDHDREAVLREDQEKAVKQAREYEEAEKRRREQLGKLTLPALRKRKRFGDWKDFAPARAVTVCRAIFLETIDALIALGVKPKKQAILTVLKNCVEKLNKLNEEHEHFIETTAVEDLCGEIDEIASAAGLREENVADRWRDW
jgi:hypothetical protein